MHLDTAVRCRAFQISGKTTVGGIQLDPCRTDNAGSRLPPTETHHKTAPTTRHPRPEHDKNMCQPTLLSALVKEAAVTGDDFDAAEEALRVRRLRLRR